MIRRIVLTDFMAHASTVIEPGPHLTVLTGPNNSGKSAVVEALRCLATNPTPKYFIRHGAKEARVEIEFDDGVRLAWVRRDKHAIYELTRPGEETQVYAKFGRKPPEEVMDVLRLAPVELEDTAESREIDVHLGNQREPIFLLNQPKTVMASFFAATTESAHLIKMQALLKNRINKAKAEERELASRKAAVEARLDRLAPLPGASLGLERVRLGLAQAVEAGRVIAALGADLDRLRRGATALARQQAEAAAYATLRPTPTLDEVASLARLAFELRRRTKLAALAQARGRALAALAQPPELFDTMRLARAAAALRAVSTRLRQAQADAKVLDGLTPPAPAAETAALAAAVRRLGALRGARQATEVRLKVLDRIAPPAEPRPVAGLAALVRDLGAANDRAHTAANATQALAGRLAALGRDIEARLAEIGACPLCGAELDAQHFLTRHRTPATAEEGQQ